MRKKNSRNLFRVTNMKSLRLARTLNSRFKTISMALITLRGLSKAMILLVKIMLMSKLMMTTMKRKKRAKKMMMMKIMMRKMMRKKRKRMRKKMIMEIRT